MSKSELAIAAQSPLSMAESLGEQAEQLVILGDLSKLSAGDRVHYYNALCRSLGLNPLTRPFQYLQLSGKLTLYATKDATEQLRKANGISVRLVERVFTEGLYVVLARATDKTGREDEATGAVSVKGLQGEALSNAMMKAETKAKRRVTLSIAGLGATDESEVDSIPGAARVPVDMSTGEIQGVNGAPVEFNADAYIKSLEPDKEASALLREASKVSGRDWKSIVFDAAQAFVVSLEDYKLWLQGFIKNETPAQEPAQEPQEALV